MNTPSLFTVTLASPVTIVFQALTSGAHYQRPPVTVTTLNGVVTDDGATVSVQFNQGQIPRRLILWSASTTPAYGNDAGTGPGQTWTNATVAARAQALIGADVPSQLAAVRALFPAGSLT